MGKRPRSRILEHLKKYYYERLAQITEELMLTLILNALMTLIVDVMKSLIFLAMELFYGKYPVENIHAVNSRLTWTFKSTG